uniref:Uncharacterized protein n=1 Tax=Avena sativa TaxID=4498 RepID=A0ACD5TT79_AVESA
MMPKIIDFGNARCLGDKETHSTATETIGSIGYMAPEFLNNYKEISYKSDIYCLVVIIKEILTRQRSYGVVENVVEYWSKRSNTSQREQILVCAEIGRDCTDFIPSRRPSMRQIIDRLLVTESTQIIPGGRPSMGNVVPLKAFHPAPGEMIDLCKTSQGGGDKGEVIDHNCAHCINQTKNPVTKAVEEWMAKHPLVGRRSEMNDLHQYMTNAFFKSIQIMSVWGISGVGKSALLQNFFCEIILYDRRLIERNRHGLFNKYGWVDVAYPFNLRDFSRSLLLSFHSQSLLANKDHGIDMMESENPIVKCRGILKKHRCLIIIDDLRSTEEWDLIHAELVSGFSKNYIIVITNEGSIAKHCAGNKGDLVFNVKCLHADAAFDLFKKEVCRKYPLRRTLPHGDVAEVEELVSKCGGLPKVIVEIAGLLANKSVGMMEAGARSMNDNFMDDLETIDSLKCLFCWMRTYMSTCPDSLKSCILYLSIFPRGHIIRRRRLVRRWIAEGYSRDNKQHEESVEENGETQLSDLVDLSIIQQPPHMIASTEQRDDTRMMSSCQVNGFIREYIVSRRMADDDDDDLVLELGGRSTRNTQGCRGRHHLVILQSWDRSDITVFESIINFSRLQSLTVFGEWRSFFISENMKLLRVLDLEDASAGGVKHEDLERMVRCLVHLKFLSLRGQREILHLPSKLGELTKLQTLDIRGTSIVCLPESIKKLAKLQYIRAGIPNMLCKKHGHNLVGVEVPRGIGRLKALHTLGVVNVAAPGSSKSFVQDLKKLTQLRKLGVSGINRKNSAKFFRAINGLVHLESLSVQLEKQNSDQNNNDCLDDMIFLQSCSNLRSLKLYGHVSKLPRWGNGGQQLGKLAKLEVEVTTLMKGDINFLGRLPHLRILRVKQLQDGELHFRDYENAMEYESYKNIKIFEIACSCSSSSLHVRFGRETMKQLELLTIDCCHGSPSYQFSGLEHLSQLKQVLLLNTSSPDTLKEQLESQLTIHPNSLKPVVKVEEQR